MTHSQDKVLSPELIRIIKIFGVSSLAIVFLLSFFNEKRANNSGTEASVMQVSDPERIYFKNVRAAYYDMEGHRDAKMTIYRHGKRIEDADQPILNFSILLNQVKDEAYIYVEPSGGLPIRIRWEIEENKQSGELNFLGGDKFAHLTFVKEIYPLLLENTYFEMWQNESWIPFLIQEKQIEALRITCVDYFRMINKPNH